MSAASRVGGVRRLETDLNGDGLRDIDVRVWQTGHGATDCEKRYEGSCARD